MIELPSLDAELGVTLRSEAEAMATAYAEALLDLAPAQSLLGVYAKGSATRRWSSLVDYVPEVSDVDVHARFIDAAAAAQTMGTVERALNVAKRATSIFAAHFPNAIHTPRPQLMVLNELEQLPGYLPSPQNMVRTLYGQDYVGGTREDYARTRADDARRFLADADFLETEVPMKLVDRPGRLAWQVVSLLTWRVGPAGPRMLTHLGLEPYEAWCLNRTSIVHELATRAGRRLAESYAAFYLAGWDGFRSGFRDGEAAAKALLAAASVFQEGRALLTALT